MNDVKNIPISPFVKEQNNSTPIQTSVGVESPYMYRGEIGQLQGQTQAAARPFNVAEYEDYLDLSKLSPNLPQDYLNELRAKNQSAGQLIGGTALQLGTTILGDAIAGIGALGTLGESLAVLIESIWNENAYEKWDNVINKGLFAQITKAGVDITNWGREAAPIYQTQKAQKGGVAGGLGDATWWASMFPTVGSAVASMVPTIGAIKGLQLVGKGLSGIKASNKLGKASRSVGRALQSNTAQTIAGGLFGAHLDIIQEIAHDYDNRFQEALNLGFSEDESRQYASKWAAKSYQDAFLTNIILNTLETNILLKKARTGVITNSSSEKALKDIYTNAARQGKNYVNIDPSKLKYKMPTGKAIWDFVKMGVNEGIEEMRVDVAMEEGELAARNLLGLDSIGNYQTFLDRTLDYLDNAQSWDSFIWGAAGGVTMTTGQALIKKILNSDAQQKFELTRIGEIESSIKHLSKEVSDWNGSFDISLEMTDDKKVDVKNPVLDIFLKPFTTLALHNGFDYSDGFFNEITKLSDEELIAAYGDENNTRTASQIRQSIKDLQTEYNRAKSIYSKSKSVTYKGQSNPLLSTKHFQYSYSLDAIQRQKQKLENELAIINAEEIEDENRLQEEIKNLSPKVQKLQTELQKLNDSISIYESWIEDTNGEIKQINKRKGIIKGLMTKGSKLEQKVIDLENELSQTKSEYKSFVDEFSANYKESEKDQYVQIANDYLTKIKNLQKQLKNSRKNLLSYQAKSITYEQELADLNANQSKLETHSSRWNDLLSSSIEVKNTTQSEYNEQLASEVGLREKLDNLKASFGSRKGAMNIEVENLKQLTTLYSSAVLQYQDLLRNIDVEFEEVIEQQKNALEASKKIDKLKEKVSKEVQKEKENPESDKEETAEETKAIAEEIVGNTELQKSFRDSNGVEYAVRANGVPYRLKINGNVYEVGSKIEVGKSAYSIQEIEILKDDNNNPLYIQLKVKNDKTNQIETILPSKITSREKTQTTIQSTKNEKLSEDNEKSSKEQINETKNDNDILKSIEDSRSKLNEYLTDPDKYFDLITYLYNNLIESDDTDVKKSTLYKAIHGQTNNRTVLNERLLLISHINQYLENKPNSISNENVERVNKINASLKTLLNQIYIANEKLKLIDEMMNTYMEDSLFVSIKNQPALYQYVRSVFTEIVDAIYPKLKINNKGQIIVNTSESQNKNAIDNKFFGVMTVEELSDLTSTIYQHLENAKSHITSRYKATDISTKLSELQNRIERSVNSLYANQIFERAASEKHKQVLDNNCALLRNFIENENNLEVKNTNHIEFLTKLLEFLTKLNNTLKTKETPNNDALEAFEKLYEDIKNYKSDLVDNNDTLQTFIKNATILYENYIKPYYTIIKKSDIPVGQVLYSLPIVTDSFQDLVNSLNDTTNYSDLKDYVGEYYYDMINKVYDILQYLSQYSRFNKKYTYVEILAELYNADPEDTVLENYYDSLYQIFKLIKNNTFSRAFISAMKGVVSEAQITEFEYKINEIQSRVDLMKDLGSHYDLKNDIIKPSIKNYIRKAYPKRQFDFELRTGLRRLTPKVYEELLKVYDADTNIYPETIELDGQTFNTKDVFDALKDLKVGQTFEVTADNDVINIQIDVDGKPLTIETIGLKDHLTYKNQFKLSKEVEGGLVYSSVFGTKNGLSSTVQTMIDRLGASDIIFNRIKEFYKIYYQALENNTISNESVKTELYSILESFREGSTNQISFIESLVQATLHDELENTELSSETVDIKTLDLEKVYTLIAPVFYQVNFKNIDNLQRYGQRVDFIYNELNKKLYKDFNDTQALIDTIKTKGKATIKISDMNKSPISYKTANTRLAVDTSFTKDFIVNDEPVIDIVEVQTLPDSTVKTVSSLTQGIVLDDPIGTKTLLDSDRHFQMHARIKHHDGSNGYSYVPLQRGNLQSAIDPNGELNQLINQIVLEEMTSIILDKDFTLKSEKDFKSRVEFEAHNNKVKNKLKALSELIIVDDTSRGDKGVWFNIGDVFTTEKGYSKTIEFKTVDRKRTNNQNGVTHQIKLVVYYDKSGKVDYINVSKTYEPVRKTKQTMHSKYAFANSENIKRLDPDKNGDRKVQIKVNGNRSVLTTGAFPTIYHGIQRSVTTAFNEQTGSYTYGSKVGKENYNPIKGEYVPVLLQGKVKPFKSAQDFFFKSHALTTNVNAIKTKSGEVITNYDLQRSLPAIYFQLEDENVQTTTTSENEITDIDVLLEKIRDNKGLHIDENSLISLTDLGIITGNESQSIKDAMQSLWDIIYTKDDNTKVSFINFLQKYNTKGENAIAAYSKEDNIIEFNDKYITQHQSVNGKEFFGKYLLHESLHKYFETINKDSITSENSELVKLYNDVYKDILKEDLKLFNDKYHCRLSQEEFNTLKAYFDVIIASPAETISYIFTESEFAKLTNRIILDDPIKNQKPKTLWDKIIDALIKLLNIRIKQGSFLESVKNIVVNNITDVQQLNDIINESVDAKVGDSPSSLSGDEQIDVRESPNEKYIDDELDIPSITFDEESNEDLDDIPYALNIGGNLNTPDRAEGESPTLTISSNNVWSIDKKSLSLPCIDLKDFLDKYRDDNNNLIC